MSEYSLTLAFDNKKIRTAGDDLEAMLTEHGANPFGTVKKKTPCFIPGHFEGGERCLAKMVSASAVVLDVDNETGLAGFERAAAAGLRAYCWTTSSHRPEKPRYRLVFPAKKSFPVASYRPLATVLCEWFGIDADPNALDACRASALPTATGTGKAHFQAWKTLGDPIAAEEVLAGLCETHGRDNSSPGRDAHRDRGPRRIGAIRAEGRDQPCDPAPGRGRRAAVTRSPESAPNGDLPRDALISPVVGQILSLVVDGSLAGQRNAFACEFGAASVEAGLDAATAVALVEPTLALVQRYADLLKIQVDLDMDGAGREVEAWLSRVDRSARRAEDGDEVRGLGSLWQRRRGLVGVLRTFAQDLRLAEAERPILAAEDAERAMASALDSDAPIVALNVSTGGGKSRFGRAWVVSGGGRAYVATPTHALVRQTKQKLLAERAVDALAREPSLLALRRPDGSLICRDPERVELALYAGDRPTSACNGCRHKAVCAPAIKAARGGPCAKRTDDAVIVFSHAGAARELTELVARGRAPDSRLLVDECPPIFNYGQWSAFHINKHLERYLTPRGANVFAAVTRLERGEDVGSAARAAAMTPGTLLIRGAPKGSRAFVRALSALAEAIACGRERDFLVRAHLRNGRESLSWRAPAPWVRAVREYADAGGRVLIVDATLDPVGIREVFDIEVRTVHVADAPGTRRVFVRDDGVTTPKNSDVDEVGGKVVRDVRLAIGDAQPAKIGLVTWQDWEEGVADALRVAYPDADVRALHFNGERGLDDLEEGVLLVTAGDPWMNAAAIGADPTTRDGKRLWDDDLQRRLVQAHGRARSARRGGKMIVHIGGVAPDPRIAPQWAECEILSPGRRSVCVASAPLSALGLSVRELARVLGCSRSTAHRRLRAEKCEQDRAVAARAAGWDTSVIDHDTGRPTPEGAAENTHTPSVDPGAPIPPPAEDPEAMVSEPMEDPTHTPIVDCDDPTPQPDYATVNPGAVEAYEDQLRRLAAEMAAGRGEEPLAVELREQMADDWYTLSTPEQHRMDELSERLYAEEEIAIPVGEEETAASGDTAPRDAHDPAPEDEEDLPDPFDGANARPFTLPDPIRHPFPTVDLVGKCPLPQPPKLKKTMSELERVELMLRAMRAVFACRFPKSPTRHLFKNARDIRQSKFWPTLLAAADALLDDDISPHCWVDWSIEQFYEQKAAPPRDPNGQGPPWMWLLSVKRLTKQGNWYRATACTTGGMVLLSREAENVVDRYRIATARLPYEDEDDVFRELFPLGYFNECHGAKVETERIFAILKRLRDSWDVHLWARYEKDIRRIVAPEIERELWGG